MEKLKERAITIAIFAGAIWVFWEVFAGIFYDAGQAAINANPTAAAAGWGTEWALQNVGWLFIFVLLAFFVGLVFWEVYKRRSGGR